MADINTPTQALPHARILRDGVALDPSVSGIPSVDSAGFAVRVSDAGNEAFVDYVSGGTAVLSLTELDGTVDTADDLDAPAPVIAPVLSLEAPTA